MCAYVRALFFDTRGEKWKGLVEEFKIALLEGKGSVNGPILVQLHTPRVK
jgi:hypothetical protein